MTREELRTLAGGSAVNEEYLMELILANIKPAYIQTVLRIDAMASMKQVSTFIQEGVIEEHEIDGLNCLLVNWHLPYMTGQAVDEELRSKCLEASDLVDRVHRTDELLSRIKYLYGGEG